MKEAGAKKGVNEQPAFVVNMWNAYRKQFEPAAEPPKPPAEATAPAPEPPAAPAAQP
jgi:hypothetical protein